MTLEKTEVQLSLEREAGESPDGSPRRARLAARYRTDGTEPTAEELGDALRTLAELLERAVERAGLARARAPRRERELAELIETYHPRQVELLDALRDEGELSDREYGNLQEYLTSQPAIGRFVPDEGREVPAASVETRSPTPAPSSGIGGERGTGGDHGRGGGPRPIPELLRTYRIDSLRQAGAVRARRQISYDEYMALKQHFSHGEDRAGGAAGSP
jgi:hypothetical protein